MTPASTSGHRVTFSFKAKYILTKEMNMGTPSENFKGIEFVRISSLPEDQKEKIWESFHQDKIIKIVKDQALMNDCILYQDYILWLNQQQPTSAKSTNNLSPLQPVFAKLAFK